MSQTTGWLSVAFTPVAEKDERCLWLLGNQSVLKPQALSRQSALINRCLDSNRVCGWQHRHLTLMEESWDVVTKGDILIAIRQITLI